MNILCWLGLHDMVAPSNTAPKMLNQCMRCHKKNKYYATEGYHSRGYKVDQYDLIDEAKSGEKER